MSLENKRIVITGGSSGIGAQLMQDLKTKGTQIVFGGLEPELVNISASQNEAKGICSDLTKEAELNMFFEKAVNHLGGIDILINNAGYVIADKIDQLTRNDYELMFAINAIAPMQLAQLALPYFLSNKSGDIVNIGATGAHYPFVKGAAYGASKAALSFYSKSMALEWRKDNIRVFHVDPSWVSDTNNGNRGSNVPLDSEKLNPKHISNSIVHLLEMDRKAFVPQMSIWATNP